MEDKRELEIGRLMRTFILNKKKLYLIILSPLCPLAKVSVCVCVCVCVCMGVCMGVCVCGCVGGGCNIADEDFQIKMELPKFLSRPSPLPCPYPSSLPHPRHSQF